MRNACRGLLPVLLLVVTAAGLGAQSVQIKEWPVPWERTRPRDPYVDGQNRVWFVGQTGNYIAHFVPSTGAFKKYEIEEGTNPHNLIVDGDGMVWYAGNRNARIGRLDPNTGAVKTYPMPDPAARDPHTLAFGANDDIWFTLQASNMIGHLSKSTGAVTLLKLTAQRSLPYGIRVDNTGRPWVVLFGTNKLATVDPQTMELREIELPRAETRPRRLEITSDGMIWFVDYATGRLGRYDAASGQVKEWPTPGGSSARPYAMTVDQQDRIWFVETGTQPNQFVGFDPKLEKFFSVTPIPSGGGAVRHMIYHAPGDEIWFGTDTNNIARASLSAK
jgi:virginiamycin B lyase